ncbi:glycosyl transferase [Mycobacterium antarcticum]|nr:glycosyl transferase [Mycolicibacterium sp. TUM20984]
MFGVGPATESRTILFWNTHRAWAEAFAGGRHRYLTPGDRSTANAEDSPPGVDEVDMADLSDEDVDLVVLQNQNELELTARWLGRRPGVDVPAVYMEHRPPRPFAVNSLHPMGGRSDIPIVHATDFNRVMWDNGLAPSCVVMPAVVDPGRLFTGDVPAAATMIDEPMRRLRETGTDLLAEVGRRAPIDVWGVDSDGLTAKFRTVARIRGRGPASRPQILRQLARRRAYVHTARWTSLDAGLMEAMYAGLPVVAFASTIASTMIPTEAGVVSADTRTLAAATETFVADRRAAAAAGKAARDYAVAHFGVDRFHAEWDAIIAELTR